MGNVINQLKAFNTKTRYKAPLLDYDWLFEQSTNGCLYCLDYQEIALLLALVEVQRWKTRWVSPSEQEIDQDTISDLVDRLENDLMTPRCGDNNAEWLARQNMNDVLNELRRERYTGNPQDIDARCPDDYFNYSGTETENQALCAAVSAYVALKMVETYGLYAAAAATAALATGLLFWLGGPLLGIAGGIVTAVTGIALNNVQAAINDHEAMENVSCRLYRSLRGVAISEENFYSALDDLFSQSDNEAVIVSVLQAGEQQPNYLHFLALLGQSKGNSDNGLDTCLCGDEWCHEWYLEDNNGGFAVYNGYEGEYQAGIGWVNNSEVQTMIIDKALGVGSIHITAAGFYIDSPGSNVSTIQIFDTSYNLQYSHANNDGPSGLFWHAVDFDLTGDFIVRLAGRDGTGFTIKRFLLRGTGTINPFSTDNCEEIE